MKRFLLGTVAIVFLALASLALAPLRPVRADACSMCVAGAQAIWSSCYYQGGDVGDCNAQEKAYACVCFYSNGCSTSPAVENYCNPN